MTLAGLSIVAISFIPAGTENTGNRETISVLIMPKHQEEGGRGWAKGTKSIDKKSKNKHA